MRDGQRPETGRRQDDRRGASDRAPSDGHRPEAAAGNAAGARAPHESRGDAAPSREVRGVDESRRPDQGAPNPEPSREPRRPDPAAPSTATPRDPRRSDETRAAQSAEAAPSRAEQSRRAGETPERGGRQDEQPAAEQQGLPTRQRPTSAPLGAASPQPSMLPPVQKEARAAGAMQSRPAADEARFAATAQAFTGAQAARARVAEQSENTPGPRDAEEQRPSGPTPPPSAQRPAPGRSNVKDRNRSGQTPVDPRLSGPVPTAAAAAAAAEGSGQRFEEPRVVQDALAAKARASERAGAGSDESGVAETAAAAGAVGAARTAEAATARPSETPAATPSETSAATPSETPAAAPAAEQARPGTAPAAEQERPDAAPAPTPAPAPAAVPAAEPARPRPEPGVRAAGIYTSGREPAEEPTQEFGAVDAPIVAAAPPVAAAADAPPQDESAGRANRRQQQRSFGQATAAALLDSSKRGDDGNGGDGSGGNDDEASSGRSRAKVAALVVAGVVVVLGIGYGVAYAVAGDSLARGATVAGIEVGGMTPEEAEETLNTQLPALVDQPFHLTIGEEETSFEVVPSAAGMTVDVPATIDEIPGGSANPVSLFQALLGGGETTPVPAFDQAALEAALTEIAAQANIEPVNGAVAFDGGEVVTSDPQLGRAVNLDATIERLEGAFFGAESTLPVGDVQLAIDEVPPAVSAEEVQRAVAEFAEPAMSAPVTVVAGEESVELPAELVGQALAMAPDEAGTLQPALDGAKLTDVARDLLTEVGQEGRDATITIEGGEPTVVPAERGMGIAPESLSAALLPVLTAEGDERQAAVELTEVDPELTTAAAEELGVTEVVGEFTTRFPHADYRNVNIGTAAERIDNTLLLPGDEFSLNGIVGERTEANGFTAGTIINGGRLEESLGGGVSQVATTTFHAAFLAGLEDVEHWPHSIYFDRYPVGQEATVAWGAKDMRFSNDTPYGVVVDTSFTPSSSGNQGTLNVKIWSTEYYRVETSVSDRSNYSSPQTIYDTSDNCSAQGGSQGFDITSYRQVWDPDGNLVKDEADPWTYNPNHRVICGPDPGEDDGEGGGDN
ncbi:VanW family protein [Jiangella endophytica]|uniref:VanW family protein n=1 Tax=Jiangella endophytica TaxID=1623398 RepID=UPI0013004082|nr:VanW family protein [Jiangella endophytica]